MATGFTELNPGSLGSKVAGDFVTEDGVTKEFQRLKVVWGAIGTINETTTSTPFPVQISSALPAGTANIGDVDIVSVPAPLSTSGSGTGGTALRVILATDSPLVSSLVTEDAVSAGDPVGFPLMARVRVQPLSDEVPAGDMVALNANRKGGLHVRVPNADISAQTQFTATGNLDIDAQGHGSAIIDLVYSSAVGTIVFEGISGNGTITHSIKALNVATGAYESSATASGQWILPIHAFTTLRVRCSAYTSGTIFAAVCSGAGSSVTVLQSATVHDAVGTSINPILVGGYASDTAPTAVSAAGDAVRSWYGLKGETIVRIVDGSGDSCMDNTNDALRVNVVAGAGGGVSATDDAAFTVGSGSVVPVAGIFRSTRDSVDDNDTGALAMNQKRGLYVSLETPNSDSAMDDTSDAVKMVGPIAHDAANAGNHNPLLLGARAADSPLAAVSADGDAVILRSDRLGQLGVRVFDSTGDSCADDANNSLRVSIVAGAGSGGTSMTDDAAFTVGTSGFTPAGGTFRTVRDTVDDNDGGAFAMTQRRALLTCIETPSGDSAMDDTNDAVRVNVITGTVLVSPNEAQSNSSITANGQTVSSQTGGYGGSTFEITGTWVGTIEFEGRSISGFTSILAYPVGSTGAPVTSTTANGTWRIDSAGFDQIRFRSSAWTSGTATCLIVRTTADTAPQFVGAGVRDAVGNAITSTGGALNVNLSSQSLNVTVDVASVVPGTSGTSLGKAEDQAAANGDTGVAVFFVRRDTASSGVGADGDYASPCVDSSGRVHVNVGTMPAVVVEDAASAGGENSLLIAGVRNDAAASKTNADGDFGNIAIDAAGRVGIADLGGSITVDGSGTFTTQDTSSLVDNAAFTDGTSRVLPVGFVFDETAGTALTENDVAAARIDSKRAQVLVIEDATTRGQRVAVNAGGAMEVQGDIAHDSAVGGNPVLIGLEARTSDGTAVTSGDAVRGLADTLGKQVVLVGAVHDLQVRGTANYTNTTASDLIAAAGAGVRIAVMGCLVTNAHATVSTKVEIRDGTTVKIQGYAAAVGGGFALSGGGVPLFISTANTAVTGRDVTTGADVDITVWGYKIAN